MGGFVFWFLKTRCLVVHGFGGYKNVVFGFCSENKIGPVGYKKWFESSGLEE